MKRNIMIIAISILVLSSCSTKNNYFEIQTLPVQINGKINGFKGGYKTGLLEYFDAITQLRNNEIFIIDSSGNFSISFDLNHPIYGSAFLNIGNGYYTDFYIEPGKMYSVSIDGPNLIFQGESGEINKEISSFNDSLYNFLGTKIQKADLLHEQGLGIEEYISFQKGIEKEKFDFLNNYHKTYNLSVKALQILQAEISFKTAHAWINYRYDYTIASTRNLRDTLPSDFYERLFSEYPINDQIDIQTIMGIHYISNIVSVLENKGNTITNRLGFIKSYEYFTPEELDLLFLLFSGDGGAVDSKKYSSFDSPENWAIVRMLNYLYNFNRVLDNITLIDQGLMRDLVVSQAISKNYFANNYKPTISDWKLIDSLIQNKFILNYLHALSVDLKSETQRKNIENEAVKESVDEIKAKYIDKYLGKVIYIDFYATWCSPCRKEIPYAKALHYEFENNNVVFLNLCAQSRMEDWEAYIEQNEIEGENYLLSNEEINLLSKLYDVTGFPTYVLIDREGIVISNQAPRPSDKELVMIILPNIRTTG